MTSAFISGQAARWFRGPAFWVGYIIVAALISVVFFDLSALRFMDSSGISVLIGAAAKVDAVELRDPSQVVRRVIELTGLTDVLSVTPR